MNKEVMRGTTGEQGCKNLLGLFWTFLSFHRLSQAISSYICLSRAIFGKPSILPAISSYIGLSVGRSKAILGYFGLSLSISGYLILSTATSGYLWLSLAISGHLWLSLSSIKYKGASRIRREQVIAI